jgi:hypothetical protein
VAFRNSRVRTIPAIPLTTRGSKREKGGGGEGKARKEKGVKRIQGARMSERIFTEKKYDKSVERVLWRRAERITRE